MNMRGNYQCIPEATCIFKCVICEFLFLVFSYFRYKPSVARFITLQISHWIWVTNYCSLYFVKRAGLLSQYSVWLRAGRPDDRGLNPGRGERIFPLASVSRPALGPTQPPVQWVPVVLFPGLKRGRGVTLITHPHLVPKSIMSRSYTSSLPRRHHGV
jgi:hypothetical protein